MKNFRLAILVAFIFALGPSARLLDYVTTASAQQVPSPSDPQSAQSANFAQDAIAKQIGQLYILNTQCTGQVLSMQDEIAKLRKQIAETESKAESKPADQTKPAGVTPGPAYDKK